VRLREGWVAHEAMLRGEPIESIELPGNANSMEEVWFERRPQKT